MSHPLSLMGRTSDESDKLSLQGKHQNQWLCTTQSLHWADSSPLACVPVGVCKVWVWCVLV